MTIQLNVAEAKAKLSALIEAAERGEEVIIARAGVPVVRIVPTRSGRTAPRRSGILKELGWTGPPTPYDAFDPETADQDWIDRPMIPSPPE